MTQAQTVSRRSFIKASSAVSAGGFLMGVSIASGPARAAGMMYTPNAWVHISDDNTITLLSARSEMGQGVYTSMPMLIAEELNVDLRQIKVAIAPPDAKLYGNALLGGPQLTGGSTSVRDGWEKLRVAGAQVRMMLISAAAKQWNVPEAQLRAQGGMVLGPAGQKATYGSLAEAASKLPVPEKPALKDPSQFTIVGKRTPRLDTPAKTNGTAEFGIDVKLPGMLYASLEQCPVIGGKVKSFDAAKAKAMPGVVDVVQIPDGVAVVAASYWQAKKARDVLSVQWDEGPGAGLNDKAMMTATRAASGTGKPLPHKAVGDADAAIKSAAKVIKAEYTMPLLSHAPLEPMNFTAWVHDGKVELIGPTQWQDAAAGTVAKVVGVAPVPSSHTMLSASRALRARHQLFATTATPSGICTTSITPGIAFAAAESTLFTVPPITGHCASEAYTMPGSFTSMPNSAVPLTLAGESRRLVRLPTMVKSFGSFNATFSGTGSCDAAAASEP